VRFAVTMQVERTSLPEDRTPFPTRVAIQAGE
jgi:hypothetical protein